MKAYHNSVVLRNDGEDPSTFKLDLNAGITQLVTVRINSTQALASIFDLDEVGTANPLTTDSNGNYAFKANDNIYDIIVAEGTANEVKLEKVEIAEIPIPSALINDLSQTYNFATVAEYKAFATAFPAGKKVYITERDISFIVISGIGTANAYNIIASDEVSQSISIPLQKGMTAKNYGFKIDGTDDTPAIQSMATNGDVKKFTFNDGNYYFAGGANTALINRSDLEVVFDAGALLTQDSTGALFWVGESSSVSNITFTGKGGKIRNPISAHTSETTGILIGSPGNTVDKFTMTGMDILMSKYGLANGAQDAIITNMVVTEGNKLTVNMNGWATGADIGQAFEMNLPSTAAGVPTAIITGNFFKMINQVSSKGDAFKWTNGVINFSDNQCVLDGQGQTVAVHSSMYQGSKIHNNSYKVINSSGTIEDALQINNSTGAVFNDLTAIVGATFGGGIQIGTNTDCEFKDLVTNETIRQTSGTTCTDCKLDGFVADQLLLSQATATWNKGAIKNGLLTGQCFITSNDCDIESITADMGGTALRALYVRGDLNRVKGFTAKNNITVQAVQVEGDNNIVTGLTLESCHSSWNVVSGDGNSFGRISFQNPISTFAQNYVDNGTNTAYVHKLVGTIAGSLTIPVPNNPDGVTTVEFADYPASPTITNFTGGKDKDKVIISLTGAAGTLTFNRDNAKLAGGANFVGNQWDTLELVYDESSSVWYETSRSTNS